MGTKPKKDGIYYRGNKIAFTSKKRDMGRKSIHKNRKGVSYSGDSKTVNPNSATRVKGYTMKRKGKNGRTRTIRVPSHTRYYYSMNNPKVSSGLSTSRYKKSGKKRGRKKSKK